MASPITSQPGRASALRTVAGDKEWNTSLCGSLTYCPESAAACCCCCCYVGHLAEKAGENYWAGCCNAPLALLAIRTKVRGAFGIRGNICLDQFVSSCCCQCASMQTKKELDFQGVDLSGPKWLGYKQ